MEHSALLQIIVALATVANVIVTMTVRVQILSLKIELSDRIDAKIKEHRADCDGKFHALLTEHREGCARGAAEVSPG